MACALSLWHSGVKDVVIVDAVEHGNGNDASRAMAIHAATLEALETINCTDALIERGILVDHMNYYDRSGTLLMAAAFDGLIGKTQFPCYLLLPQNITESVLDQKLKDAGIPLYRPYKAVDMRENSEDSNAVDVSFENGQSITAQYVIGADGAQSVVRELSEVPFADPSSNPDEPEAANTLAQMVIADVTFDGTPHIADKFFAVISLTSFFALAHLRYPAEGSKDSRGKIVYRMACGVPLTEGAPPTKSTVEYCQELIEQFGPHSLSSDKSKNPHAINVTEVVWSTRFRTRYAAAPNFFTRFGSHGSGDVGSSGARVCIVGDAAHIHPPAGGQGMNLGLRDGISLGPVIAAALTAGSTPESDELVRAHMALRRERAINVIGITKFMAGDVGMAPAFQAKWSWSPIHIYTIRDWVLWTLCKSKWVRDMVAWKFSGLEDP